MVSKGCQKGKESVYRYRPEAAGQNVNSISTQVIYQMLFTGGLWRVSQPEISGHRGSSHCHLRAVMPAGKVKPTSVFVSTFHDHQLP